MKRIRRLPVLWYYALKMRYGSPGNPGRMVAASLSSIYADPGEW